MSSADEGSEFSLPRQRRMTETHAVLWTVVVVATVGDVLLTMAGMGLGLREGNAVVRMMMGAFGPAGLWVVKFLAMCWLVAGWTLLSDRDASIFLALFAVVTVSVTGYNAVLIVESGLL
jgi:hypothetical protein